MVAKKCVDEIQPLPLPSPAIFCAGICICSLNYLLFAFSIHLARYVVTLYQIVQQYKILAGAITQELGLLDEAGIARTVARFGFHATIDHTHTLAQMIARANAGTPVIVSIPPQRSSLFYSGHILVVTGGNSSMVFLADSSVYNLQAVSIQSFLYLWSGLTAIVTP